MINTPCPASAGAIAGTGAWPVFVDIQPGTYKINADPIRDAVTGGIGRLSLCLYTPSLTKWHLFCCWPQSWG